MDTALIEYFSDTLMFLKLNNLFFTKLFYFFKKPLLFRLFYKLAFFKLHIDTQFAVICFIQRMGIPDHHLRFYKGANRLIQVK